MCNQLSVTSEQILVSLGTRNNFTSNHLSLDSVFGYSLPSASVLKLDTCMQLFEKLSNKLLNAEYFL